MMSHSIENCILVRNVNETLRSPVKRLHPGDQRRDEGNNDRQHNAYSYK